MEYLTVKELDEILEYMELPTTGLKADKIERLQDKIYIETLEMGEKPEVFYHEHLWSGVKKIYICNICGRNFDEQDRMIMHVLKHKPEDERAELLDKLVKEIENE